jgi:hypothetical protein
MLEASIDALRNAVKEADAEDTARKPAPESVKAPPSEEEPPEPPRKTNSSDKAKRGSDWPKKVFPG